MARRDQQHHDDDTFTLQGVEVGRPRRDRRKPRLKRTRKDLLNVSGRPGAELPGEADKLFADADMHTLFDRGYIDSFIGELKGGKEATVYLVGRGDERLAAKIYTDIEARSFRDDRVYWQGHHIADVRIAKAFKQRSKAGLRAQQGMWVEREYHYLWRLHEAGVRVPRPALGPEPFHFREAGAVVLMAFVGEDDVPAPRLSDVKLERCDAERAFEQTVAILRRLCSLGLVHGDLSTYNLLWHHGEVWLIDVPQMVQAETLREARALLERDVHSLTTSFRRHGVDVDPGDLWRNLAWR